MAFLPNGGSFEIVSQRSQELRAKVDSAADTVAELQRLALAGCSACKSCIRRVCTELGGKYDMQLSSLAVTAAVAVESCVDALDGSVRQTPSHVLMDSIVKRFSQLNAFASGTEALSFLMSTVGWALACARAMHCCSTLHANKQQGDPSAKAQPVKPAGIIGFLSAKASVAPAQPDAGVYLELLHRITQHTLEISPGGARPPNGASMQSLALESIGGMSLLLCLLRWFRALAPGDCSEHLRAHASVTKAICAAVGPTLGRDTAQFQQLAGEADQVRILLNTCLSDRNAPLFPLVVRGEDGTPGPFAQHMPHPLQPLHLAPLPPSVLLAACSVLHPGTFFGLKQPHPCLQAVPLAKSACSDGVQAQPWVSAGHALVCAPHACFSEASTAAVEVPLGALLRVVLVWLASCARAAASASDVIHVTSHRLKLMQQLVAAAAGSGAAAAGCSPHEDAAASLAAVLLHPRPYKLFQLHKPDDTQPALWILQLGATDSAFSAWAAAACAAKGLPGDAVRLSYFESRRARLWRRGLAEALCGNDGVAYSVVLQAWRLKARGVREMLSEQAPAPQILLQRLGIQLKRQRVANFSSRASSAVQLVVRDCVFPAAALSWVHTVCCAARHKQSIREALHSVDSSSAVAALIDHEADNAALSCSCGLARFHCFALVFLGMARESGPLAGGVPQVLAVDSNLQNAFGSTFGGLAGNAVDLGEGGSTAAMGGASWLNASK